MSVPAPLDALSDKRSVCHLYFTVSCFCSFPGPLLPTEWAEGEAAACLRAGRIYEIIPLMGYTSSVSNGLPAWGEGKGYVKEGNWISSCSTVSWNHQKNRVGTWKAIAAFQPPDSLGIFSDFSVRGREEEMRKWSPSNLLCTDSLSASFPFILFPFSCPGNFLWFPLVSQGAMWQILLGFWFTQWISRVMWMAEGDGESLACGIFLGFING